MTASWRIIGLEEHNAYENMAIDEAILNGISNGGSWPTIRFYRWKPSAVSIGRFQSMTDDVNVKKCDELGIDYVRRITGGGAVYHDYYGELTYSVLAKEEDFPAGIPESYALICSWIISGLSGIGISAQFAPINDITVSGKKISGNAQTRKNGVLLQHGTILYGLDIPRMFSVLNVSKEKISDKMIKGAEERVTCIKAQKSVGFDQLYAAMLAGFTNGKRFATGTLSASEHLDAERLKADYASHAWNFSR